MGFQTLGAGLFSVTQFNQVASVSSNTLLYIDDEPVVANDVINFAATGVTATAMKLRFDYSLLKSSLPATDNHDRSVYYDVPFPANLIVSGTGGTITEPLMATVQELDNDGQPTGVTEKYKFGELEYTPGDSSARVTFSGDGHAAGELDFWANTSTCDALTVCHFEIECELNGSALTPPDTKTTTFDLLGGSLNVRVGNNQKVDHVLKKKGTLAGGTRINWEVELTLGTIDASENPLGTYFCDMIDPAQHTYVPESFAVEVVGGATYPHNAPQLALKWDPATGKLECKLDDAIGASPLRGTKVVIRYQTALADEVVKAGANVAVKNTAKLYEDDTLGAAVNTSNEASVSVAAKDLKWIGKDGTPDYTDGTIEWTITLNTMDRNLSDLTLYDYFPTGVGNLESPDPESFIMTVTNLAGTTVYDGPMFDSGRNSVATAYVNDLVMPVTASIGPNPPECRPNADGSRSSDVAVFGIKFVQDYAATYVIKYKTKIDESVFDDSHHEMSEKSEFENNVWLDYTWKPYGDDTGAPIDFTPPGVGQTAEVHTAVLWKSVKQEYDPATQLIEWEVAVNVHQVNFTRGTITDALPQVIGGTDVDWVFVPYEDDGLWVHTTDAEVDAAGADVDPNIGGNDSSRPTLTVDVDYSASSDKEKTVRFTFLTKVNTPAHAGYNCAGFTYTNTAEILGIWGNYTVPTKDRSAATAKVGGTVLEKANSGSACYDYNQNQATWVVSVNKNKMVMTGLTLTDTLPAGQTFDEAAGIEYRTQARGASSWSAWKPFSEVGTVAAPNGGRTVIFTLGDSATEQYLQIRYSTRVDVDSIEDFRSAEKVTLTNSVAMTRTQTGYGAAEVDAGSMEVSTGGIAGKKAELNKPGAYFSYDVLINKNGLTMPAMTITDTVNRSGLMLNIDSFELRYATVDATGAFSPVAGNAGLAGNAEQLNLRVNATNNTFSFDLPAGNRRYILTYQMDIVGDFGSYSNEIAMSGTFFTGSVGKKSASASAANANAFGLSNRVGELVVTKLDGRRSGNTELQGAVFELQKKQGATWITVNTQTTDMYGQATFTSMALNKDYRLVEKTVAADYNAASATVTAFGTGTTPPSITPAGLSGYTFQITSTIAQAGATQVTITNDPLSADVTFTKENDWDRPLQGVQFTLEDTAATNTVPKMTATSGADGVVTFKNVPFGTYTLTEVAASCPDYHTATADSFDVVVGKDGKFTIKPAGDTAAASLSTIVNEVQKCTVSVIKFDAKTGTRLAGHRFQLFCSSGILRGEGVTDENGVVTFTGIAYGEALTLREVLHEESGYELSPDQTIYTPGHANYTGNGDADVTVEWPKELGATGNFGDSGDNNAPDQPSSRQDDPAPSSNTVSDNAPETAVQEQQGGEAAVASASTPDTPAQPGKTAARTSPQTGDNTEALPLAIVALCSLFVIGLCLVQRRRRRN